MFNTNLEYADVYFILKTDDNSGLIGGF